MSIKKHMKMELKLIVSEPQNFIQFTTIYEKNSVDPQARGTVPVEVLSEEEAKEYATMLAKSFYDHWTKKKEELEQRSLKT